MMPSSSSVVIISKCIVCPDKNSSIKSLQLSASDLPLLSYHYIQKGVLLPYPSNQITHSSSSLIDLLKLSLSRALSYFPPLSGRLETDQQGHIHIICNDSGVDFFHAKATHLHAHDILAGDSDIPDCFQDFFQFDYTLCYSGHHKSLISVQITELNDAVFIGCAANHGVVDGTSFWNFFNTFAQVTRGHELKISKLPDFRRANVFQSSAILKVNPGGPSTTSDCDAPLRQRIFHFSKEAIMKLKSRANNPVRNSGTSGSESPSRTNPTSDISSFQSLCVLVWRSITRARNLNETQITTLKMPANCRHKVEPKMAPFYFGNAIQTISTVASVGDLLSNDLNFSGGLLHHNVVTHGAATVVRGIKEWEENPRLFQLGNFDGATMVMGSSPRLPMYDNDFGWGRPLAVRSGRNNKYDGSVSSFPGREGDGSVDVAVVLAPSTMAALQIDMDFMQYVS